MRLSIIVFVAILAVGIVIISIGLTTNQKYTEVSEISNQYEKLEKYKNELEKINQYNQQVLNDLETQIKTSDDVHLNQLKEEIKVIDKVISDNKAELEQVIRKLSEINNNP